MDFLRAKIDQCITFDELEKLIKSRHKLTIKFGIDPTGPDVHVGHLLPIFMLRQFQKAGHIIQLIIGDFTAMIGDPSGRDSGRSRLSKADVQKNMRTYLKQIGPYLDIRKAKVHYNSEWLGKLSLAHIIADFQQLSLTEILQREDFRKRIEQGQGITLAELIYSYAQGVDSVIITPDIEVGGRDQLLNFAHARTIMRARNQAPEVAVTTPVLKGTAGDGRKMSKSYNNYIAVRESAEEKFGKIMSIPDNLIVPYFTAFADIKKSELQNLRLIAEHNPLEAKKQLGQFIVAIDEDSLKAGQKEREKFEKKFSQKNLSGAKMPSLKIEGGETYFDAIVRSKLITSKSELTRLFEQQAIHNTGTNATLQKSDLAAPGIIKIGKRLFLKLE
ncbi:tyrosine--tRNA ligase [Candidatus Wolfebacteria bacterium RIFCSPHIGHO2_01_FULL_48_22]|uniref:Tyrosine--tRNA ligase n=2 Tax=Candidatus Wolfeibacteriota TaxID=1752735 RepID=A0A1F8DQQ1_9BACT|nr:MAG: tyrosine--tRNA ligase [Candidatus Wolfebacteria bacterium RIFCSPHIGHO2_01_FULL_48_22]OGM92006.1 MAG: tyrosine--tRNA ligase [Candidatus Wolfebacteria bacterium RIFCSPLOWO2_01_FULL_47_17b]